MGTEKYWQEEKRKQKMNKDNLHPVIKQTMEDSQALRSRKHPKALYSDCLQGALFWNQWAQSEYLSLSEMAMIICRDMGCELQYCQQTLSDPYERPFEDCDQQYQQFNSCITQEQRRYAFNPEGRTMQEHILYMLEKKKKEKYFNLVKLPKGEVSEEREYFIRPNKIDMPMNNKV